MLYANNFSKKLNNLILYLHITSSGTNLKEREIDNIRLIKTKGRLQGRDRATIMTIVIREGRSMRERKNNPIMKNGMDYLFNQYYIFWCLILPKICD